jgi:hypothetical protein
VKYIILVLLSLLFLSILPISAQDIKKDTLTGSYTNLNLSKGNYYINSVIVVKDNFTIAAGVKIELIDNKKQPVKNSYAFYDGSSCE